MQTLLGSGEAAFLQRSMGFVIFRDLPKFLRGTSGLIALPEGMT